MNWTVRKIRAFARACGFELDADFAESTWLGIDQRTAEQHETLVHNFERACRALLDAGYVIVGFSSPLKIILTERRSFLLTPEDDARKIHGAGFGKSDN